LYYAVRDGFRYNPYNLRMKPEEVTASHLLRAGDGHCIDKAIFLAACARALGIPSRLEFLVRFLTVSNQKTNLLKLETCFLMTQIVDTLVLALFSSL